MSTLKIFAKLGPHTNQDAFDGWLRGISGLKEATFIREIDLELKDGIDMKELRRTLASCPFAEIIDHELLEEGTVAVTQEGLASIAGAEPEKTAHEPQVTAENADDKLLGWAEALNGVEYREEVTDEQAKGLADDGIILVCGASDDLTMFYGAFSEEESATFDGKTYFFWDGTEFKNEDAEDFEKPKNANCVVASWCPDDKDMSWAFETDAPRYATFEIMEDDDCYGEGLLIYAADLTPQIEVEVEISPATESGGTVSINGGPRVDPLSDEGKAILKEAGDKIKEATDNGEEVLVSVNDGPELPVGSPELEAEMDKLKDNQESKDGGEDEAGSDKSDEVDIASTESQEQKQDADVSPDASLHVAVTENEVSGKRDIKAINFASDEAGELAFKLNSDGKLSTKEVSEMKGGGSDGGITTKDIREHIKKRDAKKPAKKGKK